MSTAACRDEVPIEPKAAQLTDRSDEAKLTPCACLRGSSAHHEGAGRVQEPRENDLRAQRTKGLTDALTIFPQVPGGWASGAGDPVRPSWISWGRTIQVLLV